MIKRIFLVPCLFALTGCNPYSQYLKEIRSDPFFKNEDKTSTLTGIDDNKNMVRDDVELYILERYKDYPEYSNALLDLSKNLWKEMSTVTNDREAYRVIANENAKSLTCIKHIADKLDLVSGDYSLYRDYLLITSIHYNTKKRRKHNSYTSEMVSGMAFSLPDSDICEK